MKNIIIKTRTRSFPGAVPRPLSRLRRFKNASLALSLFAVSGVAAHAATLSQSANNLYIGFRALTGATKADGTTPIDGQVYILKIGLDTKFTTATGTLTLNNTNTPGLNNILTDLSAQFGSNWQSSGNVLWGVIGYRGTNGPTLYASELRPNAATQSTPWPVLSDASVRTGVKSNIDSGLSGYEGGTSTANSDLGFFQNSSLAGGYKSQVTFAGPDFGDQSAWTSVEANTNQFLDLWRITGTADTSPGYFAISPSAVITFTAVPEPSTYALVLLVGGMALIYRIRRRSLATVKTTK